MVLSLTLAVLMVFCGRLVYVQGVEGQAIASEALDLRLHTVQIAGDRGQILDAGGEVLATSVERYRLVANQVQVAEWKDGVDSAAEAAALLSPLLGTTAPELGAKLLGEDQYVIIATDLAPDVYTQVMALEIAGISGERTSVRIYPSGTTAGNLVGFVSFDGAGQAGIEQTYDDVLAGTSGEETYERGGDGQRIPNGQDTVTPAVPGQDVQLTIDRDLQYMAQAAIDEAVRTTGATWATAEVVNVKTGEILVLADSGTIDPNEPADADPSRSAAVVYEPGSTAKVITMAEILDQGIATPTSQFTVPYEYTVANGQPFHDSHEHADLKLTLTGILSQSSNTGTVMVGQNVPRQVRYDYLTKFGLGSVTGVGVPGESAGILHPVDEWDGRGEYAVMFGQSVAVTTLQATQVFATLANGGVRVQPHLVQAVGQDGVLTPVVQPEPTRVVSEATADTIVSMLESAVADGTGGNAAVPGYRIAGKTGTAQAFEGGGVVKNVASFIGIAPADDPAIVVNVTLYDPKTSIYGGEVAAPVFSDIAGYTLQYLGVPPSGTTPDLFPTTWE
ncbi:MAG: penicillin-binding protein 2 [Cellulomonadaceae bacterium]|nr:penicillin-binding protein 2 [Cellulomonadaceae bacterium]